MEVDEACIRCPADQGFVGALLAPRVDEVSPEPVERPDVVLREDVQSSQAAQQNVIGTPAPDTGLSDERLDDGRVVQLFERLELERSGSCGTSESKNRLGLALAEAEGPEGGWRQTEDV